MSSLLLRKPTVTAPAAVNRYDSLGLKDNPFPQQPTLVPTSPDPRVNGEIYCDSLHSDKAAFFRKLMIPASEGRPVQTIGFLMDAASRRGRGIGKSAFLKHQQKQIMADLGEEASDGAAVLFAAYVVPTANPSCRKFWEFSRLLFETLIENKTLSLAIWRLRGLHGGLPEAALEQIGGVDQWEDTIGSDRWLSEKGINNWDLNKRTQEKLIETGIPDDIAFELAYHGAIATEVRARWVPTLKDSFWRKSGAMLVFDWLVRLFRAAEFTRGILLIDELEKIVVHQNILERRSFVESIRYYLIDGNCQNARDRFYGILLTIHPIIQELLLAHWHSAGLDRLAPLNEPEAAQCTLYFPPLDKEMSLPLVTVYLDYFRKVENDRGTIKPFTEDAVVEALLRSGGVPGKTLNLLHRVIEKAADQHLGQIDRPFVQEVASFSESLKPEQHEELPALPGPAVKLRDGE
jgi:hypothetical protein